jgi:hypothetical protein
MCLRVCVLAPVTESPASGRSGPSPLERTVFLRPPSACAAQRGQENFVVLLVVLLGLMSDK